MDGCDIRAHPHTKLVYESNLGSDKIIKLVQKSVPKLVLSDIGYLKRYNTLNLKCALTTLFFVLTYQFEKKYCHKTPKPFKKRLQIRL